MTAIIDFDYTIFDTAAFKDAMINEVASCDVDPAAVLAAYDAATVRGCYSPERHAVVLSVTDGADITAVSSALYAVASQAKQFFYPGAVRFLRDLKAEKYRLVLLTFGDPRWQAAKCDACGADDLFDEIVITQGSKAELLSKWTSNGPFVIVNDSAEEVRQMAAVLPTAKYVMKRGPKSESEIPCAPIFDTFDEILVFLKQ